MLRPSSDSKTQIDFGERQEANWSTNLTVRCPLRISPQVAFPLASYLRLFCFSWMDASFDRTSATSGRCGKNVKKSRYSTSACLRLPSAYQASATESFARGTYSEFGWL